MSDILKSIKTLLGIAEENTGKDGLLNELISKSIDDICTECNDEFQNEQGVTVLPRGLQSVLKEWVIIQFRRQGAEGKQNESLGDYSATYYVDNQDMPKSLKRKMYAFRKMRVY